MSLVRKIAVFVSGGGTNLAALIAAEEKGVINARIQLVVSDNPNAYALKRAVEAGIDTVLVTHNNGHDNDEAYSEIAKMLKSQGVDLIVLAGYMKVLPASFIKQFENRIINLHPAILPNYGGVGMYGDNVHRMVLVNKELISGATVHFVDEGCDTGPIIRQGYVNVYHSDCVNSLRSRIGLVERPLLVKVVKEICEV